MQEHLNENGHDYGTGHHHCVKCFDKIDDGNPLKEYVVGHWSHRAPTYFPPVLATTETGHTIEGQIAIPERVVMAPILACNSVKYCAECFHISSKGCGGCGGSVDQQSAHSEVTLLWKRPNGYNHGLTTRLYHIECLPEAFDPVRAECEKRKSKIKD